MDIPLKKAAAPIMTALSEYLVYNSPAQQSTIPITLDKSHLTTIGTRLCAESLDLVRELVANAYDADASVVKIGGMNLAC
ncbi:MAG: hypothetical protein Q8L37_02360 [Candidatus Gottesmanbacteria bacterium]|nr:hypothetical protein [Candidatus Gottesmanbacteria bacterium]